MLSNGYFAKRQENEASRKANATTKENNVRRPARQTTRLLVNQTNDFQAIHVFYRSKVAPSIRRERSANERA